MNRIWYSKFMGKLDETSKIFVNANNEIQFKIEILSESPADFPLEIKRVNGFSGELERYGYLDQLRDSEEERIDKVMAFLESYYIFFSVRESEHSNESIDKKYYNAFELTLKSKERDYSNSTFVPIPVFLFDKSDVLNAFDKVANKDYMGYNNAFSFHEDDVPPFIIIGEKEIEKSMIDIKNFYVVGPFNRFNHKEHYGIKFEASNNNVRKLSIKEDELNEYYLFEDGVLFLTNECVTDIESKLLSKGNLLGVSNDAKESVENLDEAKFLSVFEETCIEKGLIYSTKDLYNFHTAMKTKSFVILSGMSGTGKSQLVQCYYEAVYKQKKVDYSNFLFIPVRPFWQDDSDLLGYLDTLNGIYRSGESGLVDFILESNKNEKECYIVCLDEMNLARVEHYFSQFLSILEREPDQRIIQLYNPKLEGRVYNQNQYPSEIKLGENLLFVGTINTDESTFRFSDKVLDRANVINLNLQNFTDIKSKLKGENHLIKKEKKLVDTDDIAPSNTFIKLQGMRKDDDQLELTDQELQLLWNLHLRLNKINKNLGIGMRIVNQIEEYIMNLPESSILTREEAFDLQISQRILTKVRGSDDQLLGLVGVMKDGILEDSEIVDEVFKKYSSVENFSHSIENLQYISKELTEYGHTL